MDGMFSGQYNASLNSTNQLTPPARFGEMLAAGAVITRGFDRNLMVLSRPAFQALSDRILSMNLINPAARTLLRMVVGNAVDLDLDSSGHVVIPARLAGLAGLSSSTVLVGLGDFFEIWSAEAWSGQESKSSDQDSDPNRFSSLNLAMR
jgi:MraZ protein